MTGKREPSTDIDRPMMEQLFEAARDEAQHGMSPEELARAREVIRIQASTMPEKDENGFIDIGPTGAWTRAANVLARPGTLSTPKLSDLKLTQQTSGMGERGRRR